MAFYKGNKFWKARSSHGRNPIFETPEQLLKACEEYYEWVDKNPLKEEKLFHHQGEITRTHIKKMRPMTIKGLCIFLGIADNTWVRYRTKEDFKPAIAEIESIIYTHKFEGAASDLLNQCIISRDLGLREATESSVKVDATITKSLGDMSDEELAVIAAGSGAGTSNTQES